MQLVNALKLLRSGFLKLLQFLLLLILLQAISSNGKTGSSHNHNEWNLVTKGAKHYTASPPKVTNNDPPVVLYVNDAANETVVRKDSSVAQFVLAAPSHSTI